MKSATRHPRVNAVRDGTVTLAMVAEAAGVSPSTVSRILNGTASVRPEKTSAVHAAIKKLGFSPNPVAQSLAGGRTNSIGVLTQTVSSPFYGEALLGVENTLKDAGYIPLFASGHWVEAEERKALDVLLRRRVDGLIVLDGKLADKALQAYARQVPVVVVGRKIKGPGLYGMHIDNEAGAALGTQHLIDLGHRRIAYIKGDPSHPDAQEREAGYRKALQQADIRFDPELVVQGDFTEAGGMLATNRLLDGKKTFTAIAASNDQAAIGALLALHRRNLRVPDDVSIVGFDDVAPARFSIPPLSTVHQSVYEAGAIAASAMLEMLAGEKPKSRLPEPHLKPRESTRRLSR